MRGPTGSHLAWVLAVGVAVAAPTALADRGVAIDVGRIDVAQELEAGGGYRLPTFGVRNPGTERTAYRMSVSYVEGQPERRPPEDWFHFSPERLTLSPGGMRPVSVRLTLPTSAEPGEYAALVGPQIVTEGRGAQVGAGAAANLTFTVAPSNFLEAAWIRVKRFFGDWSPWSYVVPGAVLLALAGWQFRKRITVTVARR